MLEKMKLKKIFSYPIRKLSLLTVCGASLGLLACGGGGGGSSSAGGGGGSSSAGGGGGSSSAGAGGAKSTGGSIVCNGTAGDAASVCLKFGDMDATFVKFIPTSTTSATTYNSLTNATWRVYNSLSKMTLGNLTQLGSDSTVPIKFTNFTPASSAVKVILKDAYKVQFEIQFKKEKGDAAQSIYLQIANDATFGVWSTGDLAAINSNLSGNYLQQLDLNLSMAVNATTDSGFDDGGWVPLGTNENAFSGSYDGNGKIINNLTINGVSYNQGLFGASSGNLTKIALLNASVTGNECVGGLVGWQNSGSISQVYASGAVKGKGSVGGLVGYQSGSISQAYATGSVSGTENYVGGLVGWQDSGNISQAYASGEVKGKGSVGGLVGWQDSGSISQSYASGEVKGKDYVGGLVGYQYRGSISQAYALGDVTGNSNVGALVGIKRIGTLANSFYLAKPFEAVNNATDAGATKITAKNSKDATQFDVLVKDASGVDSGIWMKDGTNWPIFKGWDAVFGKDPQGKHTLP